MCWFGCDDIHNTNSSKKRFENAKYNADNLQIPMLKPSAETSKYLRFGTLEHSMHCLMYIRHYRISEVKLVNESDVKPTKSIIKQAVIHFFTNSYVTITATFSNHTTWRVAHPSRAGTTKHAYTKSKTKQGTTPWKCQQQLCEVENHPMLRQPADMETLPEITATNTTNSTQHQMKCGTPLTPMTQNSCS